jgi:hypothetical protein
LENSKDVTRLLTSPGTTIHERIPKEESPQLIKALESSAEDIKITPTYVFTNQGPLVKKDKRK